MFAEKCAGPRTGRTTPPTDGLVSYPRLRFRRWSHGVDGWFLFGIHVFLGGYDLSSWFCWLRCVLPENDNANRKRHEQATRQHCECIHPLDAEHTARYPVERMAEIRQRKSEEREQLEAERSATKTAPIYYLQAAIFGDANAAAVMLTDLIDSGHDGTLIAEEAGDAVLYELHLGPYESLGEAEQSAAVVRRSHGLSPSVVVMQPRENDAEGESE